MFEPMNFVRNLSYMGIGMLSILIVMGLIIVVTVLINRFSSRSPKDKE